MSTIRQARQTRPARHTGTDPISTLPDPARRGEHGPGTPWHQARLLANQLPTPLPAQQLPLAEAHGRILAAPVRAAAPVPGFDNAAMDGYAVRGTGPWRVIGRILAGHTDAGVLADQTAVEIATGAPVPAGTERIVPYEDAHRDGEHITAEPNHRSHIRHAAEEARIGDELVPTGRVITPAVLGLAATAGVDMVTVARQPRVRVVLTGEEIVQHGLPGPGQVRDALGPLLPPLLAGFGARTLELTAISDRSVEAMTAAVAADDCDLTVVVGSSSRGLTDHLRTALARLGAAVHVDRVACRPGHPQVLAQNIDQAWIVGLPGNPYAALVAAYTLLQPLICRLTARDLPTLPIATISGPTRPTPGYTRLIPVRWHGGGVEVIPGDRPGYLGAATMADALAVIEPDWTASRPIELVLLQ